MGHRDRESGKNHIARAVEHVVEQLESRMLLTTVTGTGFIYGAKPNRLVFSFDDDASAAFNAGSFRVDRTSTGEDFAMVSPATLVFSNGGTTANVTYPNFQRPNSSLLGVFPDGWFRATVDVGDLPEQEEPWPFDFFYLAGDATHDGRVDGNDYAKIDTGFNQHLHGFVNGDFNYDGVVNFDDYAIIDAAYGTVLTPPSQDPGSLNLSYIGSENGVALSWSLPSDVADENSFEGFRVQRSLDGGHTFTKLRDFDHSDRGWVDTTVPEGSRPFYRIRAYSSIDSQYTVNTGYTPKRDSITPLIAPETPTISVLSSSEVLLSWTSTSTNTLAYIVYRSESSTGPWTPVGDADASDPSFLDSGLDDQHTYYYYVQAYNDVATSPPTAHVSAATPLGVPDAPSELIATSTVAGRIDLSWTDNSDNESGFVVQRFDPDATAWTTLPNVTTPSFQDPSLQQGKTYRYRVRATNSAGNSTWSETGASVVKLSVPTAPSNLTAAYQGNGGVVLNWTDNSDNEGTFELHWTMPPSGLAEYVGSVPANVTTFSISRLGVSSPYPGFSNVFMVRAINSVGSSAWSAPASLSVLSTPPPADPASIQLVPHRTGLRFDQEVSRSDVLAHDPSKLLLLVNDDQEQPRAVAEGVADNLLEVESMDNPSSPHKFIHIDSRGGPVPTDDDLMWITIKRLPTEYNPQFPGYVTLEAK